MRIRDRSLAIALTGAVPLVAAGVLVPSVRGSLGLFIAVGAVSAVAAAIAALVISRHESRRMAELISAAGEFADRTFSTRVDERGRGETAELASAFNTMAERLEARAKRFNETDRIKSDFVSSVSHELRTPLTTIKALTRLLMRGELSDEKRREYLETISVECDRQIDLVLNLLDLSRIEGGVFKLNIEKVDIATVVEASILSEKASADKRRHTLMTEPFSPLPPVCADSRALRRVLANLIENAIKYTADGGTITLSAWLDGEMAAIGVSDNGPGIAAEDIPRLFDKFHRGRAEMSADTGELSDAEVSGVGLGLYLARNVITQMGGTIGVDTEVGRGSTFTIRLPVAGSGGCSAAGQQKE